MIGDSWADLADDELSPSDEESESSVRTDVDPMSWADVVRGFVVRQAELSQEQPIYELLQELAEAIADRKSYVQAATTGLSKEHIAEPSAPVARPALAPTTGDPIGMRAVQSILMSATQMNLSHFHTAGMDTTASSVMPSAAEAMDSAYTAINTSMKFRSSASIMYIRRCTVGASLGHFVTTVGSSLTVLPDHENIWYDALDADMHDSIIRFYVDYKKMWKHGMTLTMLAQEAFSDDCSWQVSPDFMGMIDVEISGTHMSLWLSRMEQRVCGTPRITSCSSLGDEVVTRGSDVYAVSQIPEVDKRTIVSNDVTEVESMYGIEAAASMLSRLMRQRIVSDFMTRTGTVLPFNNREGIRTKGWLTRMGFERPKDDIRQAVISGCADTAARGAQTYEAIMTGLDPFAGFALFKVQ